MIVLAGFAGTAVHAQQVLLDTTLTIGKKPDAIEKSLDVAADANLRLTLTDFGTPAGPQRLGRLDVAVARGSQLVTTANLTSNVVSGVATKNFDATAGAYRVIIIGQPTAPAHVGAAGVRIETQTGTVLLDAPVTFELPGSSPPVFSHDLAVTAGAYTLEITDFALPQTADVATHVIRQSDGMFWDIVGSGEIQATVGSADVLQVFVSTLLPQGATLGLVGVNLRDSATGAKKFAELHELGEWKYRLPFNVASATTLTATLTDLQFPFPLASSGAAIVHDARGVGQTITGAGNTSGAAEAGAYTAYLYAAPSASGPGSAGLIVADGGGAKLVQTVQPALATTATDVGSFDLGFDIQTAGHYTVSLTDFGQSGFFDALASLSLALTRDNQIVGAPLAAAGDLPFDATPGHYSVAIVADPIGVAGQGLLGVRVHGGTGDATVFEQTEAVGTGFISATVDVASAQSVDVALADLAFPGKFDTMKVAVTRGATRAGEILGAGTFSFSATPGKYFVNLLAAPAAAFGYGTFGLKVSQTPPAPTVLLAASPTTVAPGGGVTLTWSSTDTTGCTASGGWTGTRATSGSASVGPLNADTTFALSCTGGGGSKDASVSVTITQAQRSGGGGGGGMDWLLLAWLAGAAALVRVTRRGRHGA